MLETFVEFNSELSSLLKAGEKSIESELFDCEPTPGFFISSTGKNPVAIKNKPARANNIGAKIVIAGLFMFKLIQNKIIKL